MSDRRPPFRADHVGSLLRPAAVKQARERLAKGKIEPAGLRQVEDDAIAALIAKQEEIGLQAVTDGEARRSWWHLDFLWGLDGCEKYILDQGVAFAGLRTRPEGVKVVGRVGFSGHPMVDHFRYLRDHARVMPKMTIPAPSALYGRLGGQMIDRTVYPSNDEFFADLGQAYRKAVRAFADAGCRYLQLDDVYIAMLCDERYRQGLSERGDDPVRIGEIFGDLINEAMADIPDDLTITMHLCRGNFRSTHIGEGGYEPVAALLFDRIKVHGYFMEYDTARAGGFEPLKSMPHDGRRIVLGLVTTKSGEMETRDELRRRIEEASRFVPLDQLCLSPQCGFASTEEGNILAEEEQWAKLELVVEVAREIWDDFSG